MTPPGNGNGVSKNWLIGLLTTIVVLGGGGWLTYVQAQIGAVAKDQQSEKDARAKQQADIEVIKEKTKRLEDDLREIKTDSKEQNRKLDELLRRVK